MLTLAANQARTGGDSANTAVPSHRAQVHQPSHHSASAANPGSPASGDTLALSQISRENDPGYALVKVERWGTGRNDSLVSILRGQGYSTREIYGKDAHGVTLLERISQSNNLKNPNLLRQGQQIRVPSKEQISPATTSPQTPTLGNGSQGNARQPAVGEVKVGKWGRDSNGSLYGILSNQGFSRDQILKKDANGDTLLDQVARANGLSNPHRVREGATLKVPNSTEALSQMQIPPQTGKRKESPAPRVETPNVEPPKVETPKAEAPRVEAPNAEGPKVEAPKTEAPKAEAPQPSVQPPSPTADGEQPKATVEMGLLLDGVKASKFTREEFQYLNALGNRYEETRAQFSRDGFTDSELRTLGSFETSYGVTFAKLYESDNIKLTNATGESADPKAQLRLRHYQEGGALWEGFKNGSVSLEAAINTMIHQRAEARAQGEK